MEYQFVEKHFKIGFLSTRPITEWGQYLPFCWHMLSANSISNLWVILTKSMQKIVLRKLLVALEEQLSRKSSTML